MPSNRGDQKSPAEVDQPESGNPSDTEKPSDTASTTPADNGDNAAAKARQRQERFKALQARAVCTHDFSLIQ